MEEIRINQKSGFTGDEPHYESKTGTRPDSLSMSALGTGLDLGQLILEERKLRLEKRLRAMRARSEEAARYLKERYGVSQVYLFGSLVRGRIHWRSDIDIVVIGAPKEQRMRLAAEVDRLVSPFTCHILFGDEINERMLRSVMERGVRLG